MYVSNQTGRKNQSSLGEYKAMQHRAKCLEHKEEERYLLYLRWEMAIVGSAFCRASVTPTAFGCSLLALSASNLASSECWDVIDGFPLPCISLLQQELKYIRILSTLRWAAALRYNFRILNAEINIIRI